MAEVWVIYRSRRLRQTTQTEALIIPHIPREPNSIIVLKFICRKTPKISMNLSFEEAICIFPLSA
jgi:hypothetical protein